MNSQDNQPSIGGRSAKFALVLLVIVYIFNFIDRQILSILAEEIQNDLGLDDSDIGFLYGTAFAVFYSIVGIPMGKLADSWNRKNLISIGLATWSLMTALSGTAKSFFSLAAYRIGVGVGESSASPAAYSLLSDYFSPKVRSTVLSIYGSGVYIGSGIGLFLGGSIVDAWKGAYPDASLAPLGLEAWQVAFIAVGLPGLLLAILTWQIKEPPRGLSDGIKTSEHPEPFKQTFKEFLGLTPIPIMNHRNSILLNLLVGFLFILSCIFLINLTGDTAQWVAFFMGCYFILCWIQSLKYRDPVTFSMIFGTKSTLFCLLAFPFLPFVTYAHGAFGPTFYMRTFDLPAGEVGRYLGLMTAVGGLLGIVAGGLIGDRLRKKYVNGRIYVCLAVAVLTIPAGLAYLYTSNLYLSYFWNFVFSFVSPAWLGLAAATITDLVLPRMRAIAGAFFILMLSMLGMALGPYLVGNGSEILQTQGVDEAQSIQAALAISSAALIITISCLLMALRTLGSDEASKVERARLLGEDV